jgi:ferredoxin--NADP+ reductase
VCVDGPEFDGHDVDFELMMNRQRSYLEQEQVARRHFEAAHACRMGFGARVSHG